MYKKAFFLFIYVSIFLFASCKKNTISCSNGKIEKDGSCVCPDNTYELNGFCKTIESDMYFLEQNECNCFEDQIFLVKFDKNNPEFSATGLLVLKDETVYPQSSTFAEQDMKFNQISEKKYIFSSFPINVYCNGNDYRYNWYLEEISDTELEVYVKYFDKDNKAIDQTPCKLVFKKRS